MSDSASIVGETDRGEADPAGQGGWEGDYYIFDDGLGQRASAGLPRWTCDSLKNGSWLFEGDIISN